MITEDIQRDLIVSLGTNCEVTYNLRYRYGINKTSLLDWTITPLSCLPDLIDRRFTLVDRTFFESLDRVHVNGTDSVMHSPTGVLLHHAFTRDSDGHINDNWPDEIKTVAEKFKFLGERMDQRLSVSAKPALFINGTGIYQPMDPDIESATHSETILARIIDAFGNRYPNSEPKFYILNGHAPSVDLVSERLNVQAATVPNYGNWHEGHEGHYAGCRSGWSEVLSSFHINV